MTKLSFLIWGGLLPLLLIIADQASKFWALKFFGRNIGTSMNHCAVDPFGGQKVEVSAIFDLSLVCNQGVSWGLLKGDSDVKRWALAAFAIVVTCAMLFFLSKTKDKLTALALSLLIGGSIGNVIDRIRFGAVVDFLDFSDIGFKWVFNVADSSITMGVIGLLIASFVVKDEPKAKKPAA